MRLLEVLPNGEYRLTEYLNDAIPRYATLSHTWRSQEVTYQDMINNLGRSKAGYDKIDFCGGQAARDGLQYFWVDSCCIDRSSSAELQEAINSMFCWYQDAVKCYVYLADVSTNMPEPSDGASTWEANFRASQWFTRGWTLQELLAPNSVEFFSREGRCLGDKKSLESQLHEITGIPIQAFRRTSLSSFSVHERFSWAEKRKTTRKEDGAYCLLGIFDTHMPLIYGEGRENALRRLKRKIDKSSTITTSWCNVRKVLDSSPEHTLPRKEGYWSQAVSSTQQGLPYYEQLYQEDSSPATLQTPPNSGHSAQQFLNLGDEPSINTPSLGSVTPFGRQDPDAFSMGISSLTNVAWPQKQPQITRYLSDTQNPYRNNTLGVQEETRETGFPQEHTSLAIQSNSASSSCDKPSEQLAAPLSAFEASPSFYPEAYTNPDRTPRVVCHAEYPELITEYMRTHQYTMFYAKSPRHWIRFTMSITISVESRYWDFITVPSGKRSSTVSYGLPSSVNSMIETYLSRRSEAKQDIHIRLYLGAELGDPTLQTYRSRFHATEYLKRATNFLRHLNCPRYCESALIQQPLHGTDFMAYLNSRRVRCTRFGSNKSQIDADLYSLLVLHSLHGTPGIRPFVGVIIDEQSGVANGYLSEFVLGRRINEHLAQPIAWERREKWCRQIVQAVATVHSKGFVVGCLGPLLHCGVYINSEDNVFLARFSKRFTFDQTRIGTVPPEYHHLNPIEGSLTAFPQTDIYQLGLSIWQITENRHHYPHSLFCTSTNCNTKTGTLYSERLVDPIQLHSPSVDTPQYLREIIAACRAEDPDQRLSACEILEMFARHANNILLEEIKHDTGEQSSSEYRDSPLGKGESEDTASLNTSLNAKELDKGTFRQPTSPEECWEVRLVLCDKCGGPTTDNHFHCSVCVLGNYDICPQCFTEGAHCLSKAHYLRKMSMGKVEDWYYTNVKETGLREVVYV